MLDIWSYIAEQSNADATKLIQSFHQQFPLLAEHTQLGQARSGIRADVRYFLVKW